MPEYKPQGLVYNLQNFAIHDGPGIRTLVYMKGCPLSCSWCSTPQTQRRAHDLIHIEVQCDGCGDCVGACSAGVIEVSETGELSIARDDCTYCGDCVEACPEQALEIAGDYMSAEDLFREVEKDSAFFRRSNGGVTVGGGEATMQYGFVTEFLRMCKEHYIHTAMESCAFVRWENLAKLIEHLDLLFFDVKHMDPDSHRELTGVPNGPILENISRASSLKPLIVRIPVIPGKNDSDENILATAEFAAGLGDEFMRVELLPYHTFGSQTYGRLGREYTLEGIEPPSDKHMTRLTTLIESHGVPVQIGS